MNGFNRKELHHQYRYGEYSFSDEECCKTSFLKGINNHCLVLLGMHFVRACKSKGNPCPVQFSEWGQAKHTSSVGNDF